MDRNLRYIYILFVFFIATISAKAQPYGNEWINYSQRYYKIKVSSDGVYRVSYQVLANSEVPINSFDPRQIQIFKEGIEQHIYVHGENDGIFHPSDYIEFYAERNKGKLDKDLYLNPADQPNPDYSLFNDTTVYFLTWNNSISNKRLKIESDKNFDTYTPEDYVWSNSRINYIGRYFSGKTDNFDNTDPRYTDCEGWFDNAFFVGNSHTSYSRTISTAAIYAEGPPATIDMLLVGASNNYANPDHHIVINFAGISIDTIYDGYVPIRINKTCAATKLNSPATFFFFDLPADIGATADYSALSYIDIRYPRQLDMDNYAYFLFDAKDGVAGKSFFKIRNLNAPAEDSVIVYDITNNKRVLTSRIGTNVSFLVPNSGSLKKCFVVANSSINSVSKLFPVNGSTNKSYFTNFSTSEYSNVDYLIVTHNILRNKANEYADYRKNTGYKPLVVDVGELYDQFYYGIELHPLAISRFARYAEKNFADTIRALFIIGKGYRAGESNDNYRNNSSIFRQTLVPSIGNPPSDQMFTSNFSNNNFAPSIPTGRLAARNKEQVGWYLNKIKDYESELIKPYNPLDPFAGAWRKKVLHFAGGDTYGLMKLLLGYLNQYKDTLKSPYFGADVITFTKSSTAPIQQNQSDSLKTLVNNGVAIMNFFGHAAGIGFDISIDNPQDYNNYKRYSFMIANSCFAGDLFESTINSSEAFVCIENKGAIGFLGAIKSSTVSSLHQYSSEFIRRIARENYNQPVGYIIKKTLEKLQLYASSDLRNLCFGMTLHGDPMLKMGGTTKPDLMLTQSSFSFEPTNITTEMDSFTLNVYVYNIGLKVNANAVLEVTRTFADNTQETYSKMIECPDYRSVVSFRLPITQINGVGLNKLYAKIDAYDAIDESEENNNDANTSFFVVSNQINPVYPYEFQVLPDTMITLVASTGYAMAPISEYVFQIDTIDTFDSYFMKQSPNITKSGGVVEWKLPFSMISLPDSTVYYWRIKAVNSNQWGESSFQYITNKKGWGQAHFFQFKKDEYQYVNYNRPFRKFDFVNVVQNISAQTGIYPNLQWEEEWIKINNKVLCQWHCAGLESGGMKFAVFDTIAVDPWANPDPDADGVARFGSMKCHAQPYFHFDFATNGESWYSRMTNLIDSVPNGYYVLAISHRNHNAENYPESLYKAFEKIGSNIIRTIPNNVPYIIFGRKNHLNAADERIGSNANSIISGSWTINTNWREGMIESTMIGPAKEWSSLHWRVKSYEQGVWSDTVQLSVIGIKIDGSQDTVIKNLPPKIDSLDIYNLTSRIDANIYPYLKLCLKMSDDSLRTPAQLERWQVLYEPIPETAIDPNSHFSFYNDTINEGEKIKFSIATHNVGPVDFPDSLDIAYWLIDNNRNLHKLKNKKLRLHPIGDILIDSIAFSTEGFAGNNSLWVEFNPINTYTGQYYQLEQHHFNNIAEIKFFVSKDRINPMLDVTFDGVHILDGDIVSASPRISIMLKDENRYLMLDDTASFRIYLKRPGKADIERVAFVNEGVEKMRFYPPKSSSNNTARIEYDAGKFIDGKYCLIVQARDKSGNESGTIDYKINFEVINKPAITDVLNYPNPFSTQTRFVFTLTGSDIPEYFKIQIMTITGKVVREIDKQEIGNIHIGRNITQYAWDGRDQYGDLLANGVYLYRVVVKLNGQNMDKIDTPYSQYFTKEFGKMMLIR